MSLLKQLTNNKKSVDLGDAKSLPILRNVGNGQLNNDAVNVGQAVLKTIASTISAIVSFTGNNTHTGTETFSNATGVTTDIISELTAGNGTAIKTHVVVVSGSTLAPTALTSGTVYTFAAAAITVTLPAASAANVGLRYKFVTTTIATAQIINTTGTDVFIGSVFSHLAVINATNDTQSGSSTANKTMTMNGTTTGGLPGSVIEVVCISATQWLVTGRVIGASGTQATLFSN